jgi:hypothetical protein
VRATTSDDPRHAITITTDERHAIAGHARQLQRLVRRARVDRYDVAVCVFELGVLLQQVDERLARRGRRQ